VSSSIRPAALAVLIASLGACATSPERTGTPSAAPGQPQGEFSLQPAAFDALPGWSSADLAPALTAFRRQCESWRARAPDTLTQGGRDGGPIGAWLPACNGADTVAPGGERSFFEANFTAARVAGAGEARLTAYFEPVIEARRSVQPGFDAPLLKPPSDMVTVDLEAFAAAYDSDALRGAPRALTGRINGKKVEPYPARASIAPAPGQAFAWTHRADLYNLQVQGSGRLRFNDGTEVRAQFGAQNGYRWRSALGALRDEGRLASPTWSGFRQWLDAHPEDVDRALSLDPSYVFFEEAPINDPNAGPRGAAGVPLTPMGSIAIDPAFHPYGALLFVEGAFDGAPFSRLLVAQDTGGAIRRGPQRGDVFFGTGAEAGARAERMNAQNARFWTLLPRGGPVS
jgi:membrane-bound lytic murein transglycosylase A